MNRGLAKSIDNYCDAKDERWIWSIARNRNTGEIVASLSADLYSAGTDPLWECIWLR